MATRMETALTTGSSDLDQIFHLAAAILPSGMLPDHIKSEGAAVAIILAGRELGLPPMVSLRTIRLVKGNVTIDASQQLALVHAAGWRSTWKESTNQAATLELSRAGQDPHLQTFTIQDAKLAGLTGKDPWRKYPAAMLRARCISAAVRAACPGVLSGVYTPEELETETEEGRPPIEVIDLDDDPAPAPEVSHRHDPSFERDRSAFMARIFDLGWRYDPLCEFLESIGKPRPSTMTSEQRDRLCLWLTSDPPQLQEWDRP